MSVEERLERIEKQFESLGELLRINNQLVEKHTEVAEINRRFLKLIHDELTTLDEDDDSELEEWQRE